MYTHIYIFFSTLSLISLLYNVYACVINTLRKRTRKYIVIRREVTQLCANCAAKCASVKSRSIRGQFEIVNSTVLANIPQCFGRALPSRSEPRKDKIDATVVYVPRNGNTFLMATCLSSLHPPLVSLSF